MRLNRFFILLLMLTTVFAFAGCEATDLVAKASITSFDSLVKTIPDQVAFDGNKGGWVINAPDKGASIILNDKFNGKSPDIVLKFDAVPFLKAGLDAAKLPKNQYIFDETSGNISMPFDYGQDEFGTGAAKSALDTFKLIVRTHREIIGYHEEGDHYKIDLGRGNSFAWAKEISSNKKDMLFILNPQPLIDAGVDAGKVKGWMFAKLPVTGKDGRPMKVDVFIKSFNIK